MCACPLLVNILRKKHFSIKYRDRRRRRRRKLNHISCVCLAMKIFITHITTKFKIESLVAGIMEAGRYSHLKTQGMCLTKRDRE